MVRHLLTLFLLPFLSASPSRAGNPPPLSFPGTPGPHNAITDVVGVTVGHHTLLEGESVRTGVTAILPRGNRYDPVLAGWHTLNGNGELTGLHWIKESGFMEGPVLLTNTHSVGAAHEGFLRWAKANGYYSGGLAALPVIGETWDGFLNDINGFHVRPAHAVAALDAASPGPVNQGSVGGGTGMICFRFKGGIGSASRIITIGEQTYTVGVLVQANFGRREDLTIRGKPVGAIFKDRFLPATHPSPNPSGNSIICVIATDAPLLPHQLDRVAQRGVIGVARTGGTGKNSSGDFFLAFSTANPNLFAQSPVLKAVTLANDQIDSVFDATIQATEEAIINAMLHAELMVGRNGNTVYPLPKEELTDLFEK